MGRAQTRLIAALMSAILLGCAVRAKEAASQPPKETVILLHGLFNKSFIMSRLAHKLQSEGYDVINWGYHSRLKTVEEHAAALDEYIKTLGPRPRLHFVGFSMGAIVIRYYLTHYKTSNVGRFVMIGPPNHGSELCQKLYGYRWFRWLYGQKATPQLQTSNTKFFEECGTPPYEFGIIAGVKGDGEGYSKILPGDDDGTVSLESARLDGAADFVELRHQHTMLPLSEEAGKKVLQFIKTGRFDPNEEVQQ